jgi:hypothetical protein
MANTNIANVKPPKSPNLPIPPTQYSQDYMNQFTDALRLYFNQVDILLRFAVTSTLGYYLDRPYGQVLDTTAQAIVAANTAQPISFDTQDGVDGTTGFNYQPDIYINPLSSSQVIVLFPSIYDFSYSLQLTSTDASTKTVYVWLNTNGVDVPGSTNTVVLSGAGSTATISNTLMHELVGTSGNLVMLMWASTSTAVTLTPAAATAFCPGTPSARLNITQACP